jgi:hypothetical protein
MRCVEWIESLRSFASARLLALRLRDAWSGDERGDNCADEKNEAPDEPHMTSLAQCYDRSHVHRLVVVVALLVVGGCRLHFDDTGTDASGTLGEDDASTGDAAVAPNLMFVTSTNVDLCAVGVAGADAECTALATAAGLPGNYRAWASQIAVVDAKDRFGNAAGWVRIDGRPFADSIASIIAGELYFPPRIDETGTNVGITNLVTGTQQTGVADTSTACMLGGYTSNIGYRWSSAYVESVGHIACLGVDRIATVPRPQATGRIAFVTTGLFDPSTGRASADALCASEATAASLPGSYLAFLSTTTQAGSARFDLTGAPWVRTDGVPIMQSANDLATWNLLTGIDRHADQTLERLPAWSGSIVAVGGTAEYACNDWTSNQGMDNGIKIDPTESTDRHYTDQFGCARLLPVLCFQL